MGVAREPLPVKLVVPMLSGDAGMFEVAERALTARYGPVDHRSEPLRFTHTAYYAAELGPELWRVFLGFRELIDPGRLAEIKRHTNALEADWAVEGRRRINLDPGYITGAKLVLATTKDHAHRIYLGGGIHAEVTLAYRDGRFRPWPWTYPDYRSEEYLEILHTIRATYMAQLREKDGRGSQITPMDG